MPKKNLKIKDENGKWIELTPDEFISEPVQRELTNSEITRIKEVHDKFKEVIMYQDNPMSLEQFEVAFMREKSPDDAIALWERLAIAYQRACKHFPATEEARRTIYHWLILLLMGAVSDDEKQKDEVKIIQKCFAFV